MWTIFLSLESKKFSIKLSSVNCSMSNQPNVGVELNHMSLSSRVLVPFTPASEISGDKVLSVMERIQQSKESFKFDESMVMKLVIVEMPQGGKGPHEASNTRIVNWDEWYKKHCGHGGCFLKVNQS